MNWRNKARLAKAISKLPYGISNRTYYFFQRHFGSLRTTNPVPLLKAGVAIVDWIRKCKHGLTGSEVFLEIGTGRYLSLPITLWLCGACQTITVDLNPYLKSELVFEEIEYIRNHLDQVISIFNQHKGQLTFRKRFDLLLEFQGDLNEFFSLLNVRYIAPADTLHLDMASQSVDYQVSFGVIEHIASDLLDGVFVEAKRLLKKDGLAIHWACLADLFSGIDDSISPVNFLQFSEEQWQSIAGNRYMYHNRLRVDELRQLFERTGFQILEFDAKIHPESLRLLKTGLLPLNYRFRDKSPETNASQHVWVTAGPACHSGLCASQIALTA